jgi:hypothetical protein
MELPPGAPYPALCHPARKKAAPPPVKVTGPAARSSVDQTPLTRRRYQRTPFTRGPGRESVSAPPARGRLLDELCSQGLGPPKFVRLPCHAAGVLLAYLDESYDKGEYWMTGLCCPSDSLLRLQSDLDAVVASAAKFGVSEQAELHGNALVHGKDDWVPMAPAIRARIQIYESALDAVAAAPGLQVFQCGVDRARLVARYAKPWHPHTVTLSHVLQRLDGYAAGIGQPVLTIADEVGDHDVHRADLWSYQRTGTISYFHDRLNNIADTLHFAPSKHSRLLQAADLVSYLHFRVRRTPIKDARAVKANADLWARVAPLLRHPHFWTP